MSPATWHRDGESYITCKPDCAERHAHYVFQWVPVLGNPPEDADFASLLEREPPKDPIMGVLEVYAKDDPYCWAIIKAARHEGRLTPELVAELIRHQCERAKLHAAQIDKLARTQPPAPIQIDGAAATMLDLAKKTSESQAAYISSLKDVLVAIRAKLARKIQREVALWDCINEYAAACGGNTSAATSSGRRMDAVVAVNRAVRMDPDDAIALINETLDPCEPWCVAERPHEGICMSAEDFGDGE